MYKVFSGPKTFLFDNPPSVQPSPGGRVIEYNGPDVLRAACKEFRETSGPGELLIYGPVEPAWEAFKAQFEYIEAAGGLVFNPDHELLMIFRNKHWDLPKGKVEKGESPAEGAVREVEEECGITGIMPGPLVGYSHHTYLQGGKEILKRTYWFRMKVDRGQNLSPQEEEGIEKVQWMSEAQVSEIRPKMFPSLQDILTAVSF